MPGKVKKLVNDREVAHRVNTVKKKNQEFQPRDWAGLDDSVRSAFRGSVRMVVLRPNFGLFKLSANGPTSWNGNFVTPWWSPLMPYEQDKEGAKGRFEQARLNGINMSAMVRYMSAVCIDWNDLDQYFEIHTTCELKAFWGMFAPQKFHSSGARVTGAYTERLSNAMGNADLPDDLGVLDAWQFYIPNLEESHFKVTPSIAAHDSAALAQHFRV